MDEGFTLLISIISKMKISITGNIGRWINRNFCCMKRYLPDTTYKYSRPKSHFSFISYCNVFGETSCFVYRKWQVKINIKRFHISASQPTKEHVVFLVSRLYFEIPWKQQRATIHNKKKRKIYYAERVNGKRDSIEIFPFSGNETESDASGQRCFCSTE